MKSLSIRLKGRVAGKSSDFYPIHDLRLYSPERLPKHVDPGRTKNNRILFALGDLPKTKEEVANWVKTLEEENRQLFKHLKEMGVIAKNQGYKIARPYVGGILTLSHEAQKDLRQNGNLFNKFLEYATEYLQLLAKALGTDLLYAVAHLDETAPHVHFAFRNLSYKDPDPEALKKLGWEDLAPKLQKAKGKAISNLFHGDDGFNEINGVRDYQIHFSRLQDSLEFFRPLGFGRGVRKKERMARGEPYWKVINRSVRELHEDLPKEIKLKRSELAELEREVELKKEELEMLEREKNRLLEELRQTAKKEVEKFKEALANLSKNYEEFKELTTIFVDRATDEIETLKEEVKRLKEENETLRKETESLKNELLKAKETEKKLKGLEKAFLEEIAQVKVLKKKLIEFMQGNEPESDLGPRR